MYPVIKAYRNGDAVIGVYNDMVVSLDHNVYEQVHLVNGEATTEIVVDLMKPLGDVAVEVYDTRGDLVRTEMRSLSAGLHRFVVPAAGLVSLTVGSGGR